MPKHSPRVVLLGEFDKSLDGVYGEVLSLLSRDDEVALMSPFKHHVTGSSTCPGIRFITDHKREFIVLEISLDQWLKKNIRFKRSEILDSQS